MDTKQVSVALSQEELFVLLAYLEVDSLMGLNNGILHDLSKEQIQLVLGVAQRALIARGFLTPTNEENRYQLVPLILSLIGTCVKPDSSLIITYDRPQSPAETYFYHQANSELVQHTIPVQAIHQFIEVTDPSLPVEAVTTLFRVNNQPAPTATTQLIQIPQAIFTQARQIAFDNGANSARQTLIGANVEKSQATALAQTLAQPIANMTLVALQHQANGSSNADGFTILHGSNGFWLLQPTEDTNMPEEFINIQPITGTTVTNRVTALVHTIV